jgi:hypothetical protein
MSILTITEYSNDVLTVTEKVMEITIADFDTGHGAISESYLGAKGSLVSATAAETPVDVAVGTDGQYLSADSGEASGLKWVTPTDTAKYYEFVVVAFASNLTTGDGKYYFVVPPEADGKSLTFVNARLITAATGANKFTMMVHNLTDAVDMLSTALTTDASETGSQTAAVPYVIDTTKDEVSTYDVIRIDIDQVGNTVAGAGLIVTLGFA